ncbi:Rad52/Rad22 family DNA repair protein [Streptomyces sp. NPDC053079]|uniref:Rad52/Rad22 family DNA repair protein n=1 Tax=Streptomyces sp. NPDC053079 TaxID=3365697 RepID=UPI0037D612E3
MTDLTSRLTEEQLQVLFAEMHQSRVGFNPKGFAHLHQWDVRRFLIRVFGFGGYDTELVSIDCVREISLPAGKDANGNDKFRWTVVYRVHQRLTVKDIAGNPIATYDGVATGDARNQPSLGDAHDGAVKEADSQSLKRAAVNLGDAFGLSLYNGGETNAVVIWSAAHLRKRAGDSPAAAVPEDPPVLPEPGTPPEAPAAAPKRPAPPPVPQGPGSAEEPGDRASALAAMLEAAGEANFTDGLAAQFRSSFGHDIEQGTIAEFQQARDLLLGSVAP